MKNAIGGGCTSVVQCCINTYATPGGIILELYVTDSCMLTTVFFERLVCRRTVAPRRRKLPYVGWEGISPTLISRTVESAMFAVCM